MKAKDIQVGVVYAYGLGEYDRYDAVVIVEVDRAVRNELNGDVKFSAVRVPSRGITDEVITALENLSEKQDAATVRLLSTAGLHADLVLHRMVRGRWKTVLAERERRNAAIAARRVAEQAIRDEEQGRREQVQYDTLIKLARVGVTAMVDDDGDYILDQEQADKLIERLGGAR